MRFDATLADRRKWASLTQRHEALLSELTPEQQAVFLADALVRRGLDANGAADPNGHGVRQATDVRKTGRRETNGHSFSGGDSSPNGAKRARGKTRTLLRALHDHPKMPIAELARALYGADDIRARRRVASMLTEQRGAGRVENANPGSAEWVLTPVGRDALGV